MPTGFAYPMQSATKSINTKRMLFDIWHQLRPCRRRQLFFLGFVMLASSASEVFSLAAVLPFLGVLADPALAWRNPVVQQLANILGLSDENELLLPVTIVFVVAVILAAAIRLSNLWLNSHLAAAIGSDLSCEAYCRTLHQPYSVHVQRNTSEVIAATTIHISHTVLIIQTVLQLITALLVSVGILLALVVVDWQLALVTILVFVSAYGLIVLITRRRLASNSLVVVRAGQQQLKALKEGLGAIRDVLLDGTQLTYLQIYRQADRPLRLKQAQSGFLSAFPRYSLEALAFLLIAFLALLLSWQRGSATAVLPLLGTLALGSQRLLPALQQVYSGWATIRAHQSAVLDVLALLDQPMPSYLKTIERDSFRFQKSIKLKQLSFRYADEMPSVLHPINLEIRRGERIGIIGSTGSGKSTLLDLLMGLLEPTTGVIMVDDQDLQDPLHPERLLAWRHSIAHVPQSVYLIDGSIAENIAFGVPIDQISNEKVRLAASQAQISSFIESRPGAYNSFVGERGIRLSEGQRQRIGIARALYKQTSILVFDEATSALDITTENAVMDAVENLSKDLTIVMIAHRLSTVKRCDRIIELEKGIIINEGSPNTVLRRA